MIQHKELIDCSSKRSHASLAPFALMKMPRKLLVSQPETSTQNTLKHSDRRGYPYISWKDLCFGGRPVNFVTATCRPSIVWVPPGFFLPRILASSFGTGISPTTFSTPPLHTPIFVLTSSNFNLFSLPMTTHKMHSSPLEPWSGWLISMSFAPHFPFSVFHPQVSTFPLGIQRFSFSATWQPKINKWKCKCDYLLSALKIFCFFLFEGVLHQQVNNFLGVFLSPSKWKFMGKFNGENL